MKLIDILVQELPERGGWIKGHYQCAQDKSGEVCFYTEGKIHLIRYGMWSIPNDSEATHDGESRVVTSLADDYAETIITREQYEAALAASKPKWDGVGLPPVGCRVEYTCKQPDLGHPAIEAGKWYGGTIIAYYDECVWTSDNGIRHLSNTIFRPMQSEEGKKRYAAIEALFEILDAGVSTSQDSIDIYDAIAAGKIPHIRID